MKKFNLLLLSLLTYSFAFAQTGTISGVVNDGQFNDVLPFANIIISGTQKGTTSDFEGKYSLDMEPGTYIVEFSFVGYGSKQITDVVVKSNANTVVNVTLSGATLDELLITTTARKNTEQSVLNLQKKSVQLLDGLSLESIKKSGASNVASAVKNVPGVSVQGGKFVYVRGLGDRYTKSILNGVDVPGLDPDRNTLQLDVFPSSILENVIVVKSATADQPADFTGGVVNIVTKDIPSRKERNLSFGANYNPDFHFNGQFIQNEASGTDFLGFDNGLRSNPISPIASVPEFITNNTAGNAEIITGAFDQRLGVINSTSGSDFNFSYSQGNSYDIGDNRLGYIASLSYTNNTTFYDNYIDGQLFRKPESNDPSDELTADITQQGILGNNNVLISGLGGLTYKTEKSKYKFNILHLQNGESQASLLQRTDNVENVNSSVRHILLYTERSITNFFLSGKHSNEDASWVTEWKIAPTLSKVEDKDFKLTPLLVDEDNGSLSIDRSETGDALRFYRDLEDITLANKLDFTRRHSLFDKDAKLKFGAAYTFKERDFSTTTFLLAERFTSGTPDIQSDPDNILGDFAFTTDANEGYFYTRNSDEGDVFNSKISVGSLYISDEFKPTSWFTAVIGVRFEKYDQFFSGIGQFQGTDTILDNERIIDKADLFPSANLIFDINEEGSQKIRSSFSRTTARPSFKEASNIFLFNPTSGLNEIGNLELEPSYINNFDLRYEIYGQKDQAFQSGDFFALSGFYKTFKDPIEQVFFISDPNQITWDNLGDANVIGAEIEVRKNLGFIGLSNFSFNTNVSVIQSQETFVDAERESRENLLRPGETLDDGRQLQGQSPFLLNTGLTFDSGETGWKAGLFYNVQGRTLQIVGALERADVFTLPFNDLKFNLTKTFGEDNSSALTIKVGNILDDDRESVFESFGSKDQVFSRWSPGQNFSLGYSFKF